MGIENLRSFIHEGNKKRYAKCVQTTMPRNIASLFIDCNGIFHRSAQIVYRYGSKPETKKSKYRKPKSYTVEDREELKNVPEETLEKEYLDKIIDTLKEVLNTFNPKHSYVIAPDGVANSAKINQQKTRRYLKTIDSKDPTIRFDSNGLTPGTPIMVNIDKKITEWLESEKNLPEKTIYSSHMDPGEGEHKIFHYIRQAEIIHYEGSHIVYGADGDLFVLSILSPLNNIYLVREDNDTFYNINILKNEIYDEIKFEGCHRKTIFQDFCVMMIFAGDDFLPKFPNSRDTKENIETVFKIYKRMKKHLTDKDNNIIWENYHELIKRFNQYSVDGMNLYEYIYKNGISDGRGAKKYWPYSEAVDSMEILDTDRNVVHEEYNQSKHFLRFDLEKFKSLWYPKQFKPRKKELQSLYRNGEYYTKKDINHMCLYYLKTVQWIQYYYTRGYKSVSSFHFYPYIYTPLPHDVYDYMTDILKVSKDKDKSVLTKNILFDVDDEEFTAVHQLAMVMPPQSIGLIPEKFQEMYTKDLACISPVEFEIIPHEGTNKEYVKKPAIPPINPFITCHFIEKSEIPIPDYLRNKRKMVIKNKPRTQNNKKFIDYRVFNKMLM